MSDAGAFLTAKVEVVFPKLCSGIPQRAFYKSTVNLTDLPEFKNFGQAGGFINPGTKVFRDKAWARYLKTSVDPINKTALDALALRIARDYYYWLMGSYDLKYVGILSWAMEGLSDTVEFAYHFNEAGVGQCSTRVSRRHFGGDPEELAHQLGTEVNTLFPFRAIITGGDSTNGFTWIPFAEYDEGGWWSEAGVHLIADKETTPLAFEINGGTVEVGAIVELRPSDGCFYTFGIGGGTESFLAQLTAKCYYDGSTARDVDNFTPIGPGLNCPPDLMCLDRFIAYSWVRVGDSDEDVIPDDASGSGSASGSGEDPEFDECPVTYSQFPQAGSPQCFPAYHENDVDLPVFPPSSPQDRYPTIAISTGSGTAWTNPGNVTASDDQYATATLTASSNTATLKVTGFCFGLAGNATIDNVDVRVEGHANGAGLQDLIVKLVVLGVIGGTDHHTGADLPLADAVRSYSDTPGGWGVTLTPLKVNRSDFGVAISYTNTAGVTRTVSIDTVVIRLSFTPSGFTAPRHCIVRLRRGAGNYYLIDQVPWEDGFRRTGDTDADGAIGFLRYWDQNTRSFKDGEEVRIVEFN